MPSYIVGTSFAEANSNTVTLCGDNSNPSLWKDDNYSQIKHVVDDVESERMQNLYWLIISFPSLFHRGCLFQGLE